MPIGTKQATEKLAHDRDGAPLLQHELGQCSRLMDALPDPHAWQRGDRLSQVPRQDDTPLALIIPSSGGTFPREQFNVIQRSFAVERLADIHAPLPGDTDRAIADQVTYQPRKGQRARAFMFIREAELQIAGEQFITSFIGAGRIDRSLEAHHEAVTSYYQLVGPHPAAISAQDFVIGSANQRAPVLQHDGNARALTLHHHLGLHRCAQLAVSRRAKQPRAACIGHLFNAPAHAVR